MQRFMTGLVVAAVVAAASSVALASNQETAEMIARHLKDSGQMHDYKIGVKYQDGTTWLAGRVNSEQQMSTALRLVLQMPGVDRVINNMNVAEAEMAVHAEPMPALMAPIPASDAYTQQQPTSMAGPELGPPAAPAAQPVPEQRPAQPPQPRGLFQAMRLPSSFNPTPVEPTGAQQPTPARRMASPQPTPARPMPAVAARRMSPAQAGRPLPIAYNQQTVADPAYGAQGAPRPMFTPNVAGGAAPVRYDQPYMPNHAWPSYAPYPNYAAVTYPKQYSATAWPYIGPFYPYPQVPLGWRKVTLEWDDGWWMLDFKDR